MLWLQYLPVLIVITCNVTVSGLRITSQNTKVLKNQLLKNNSASWIHKNSVINLTDRPTKRQTHLSYVDNSDTSNLETFYDNQEADEFDVKNTEESPSYRQVILDPNDANVLRPPRAYPFHPLHFHWGPRMEPVEIIPNPIPVHHYRKVPVVIRVPKYENVPEPYYVPYKPSPDYTITHVDVYHPGM